jgi:hypothetical protein
MEPLAMRSRAPAPGSVTLRRNDDVRAARHLFRFLGNAEALRTNPLAASVPGGGDALLAAVREAVLALADPDTPTRRLQRDILIRCDLDGVAHKVAIGELGISRRTFYYHRRRALERFAATLRRTRGRPRVAVSRPLDAFEIRLAAASQLAALGRLEAARDELKRAASHAATAAERARALSATLSLALDAGHLTELRDQIEQLGRYARKLEGSRGPGDLAAWLDAATTAAALSWKINGASTDAYEALSDAARVARHATGDALTTRVRVAALATFAEIAEMAGVPGEPLAALADAERVLTADSEGSPVQRARLLIARVQILLSLERPLAEAVASARSALRLSAAAGFVPNVVDASVVLAMSESARDRHREAIEALDAARPFAAALEEHEASTLFYLTEARVNADAGAAGDALAALARAERQAEKEIGLSATLDFTRAAVALAARRAVRATRCAARAASAAQRLNLRRMIGGAFLLRTRALVALGRTREAADASETAVWALERHGGKFALASAYALAGQLTRNRRHAARALELRAVLHRPFADG